MKFIKNANLFILITICVVLTITINITYSKFAYSKEISSQITTISTVPTVYSLLAQKNYTLDTNVNFGVAASNSNGQGLMMRNGTQNDTFPILYYRGNVVDNNVLFGGFCWLIVRTTETGGLKLAYNGSANSDGSCNNYSGVGGQTANSNYSAAYIQNAAFNTNNVSPVSVGYMYNDTNTYLTSNVLNVAGYKAHLLDESRLDSGMGKYTQNKTDSNVKGIIDGWYESNIGGEPFENLLEDTVWCNDRSVTSESYSIDNYYTNNSFEYSAYTRTRQYEPSLACTRNIDKFTVNKTNGNGDLTYPIGLLTADEILMAGSGATFYLATPNGFYWSLSPCKFYSNSGASSFVVESYSLYDFDLDVSMFGVRPSISLKNNATITDGDGSFSKPFVIS